MKVVKECYNDLSVSTTYKQFDRCVDDDGDDDSDDNEHDDEDDNNDDDDDDKDDDDDYLYDTDLLHVKT